MRRKMPEAPLLSRVARHQLHEALFKKAIPTRRGAFSGARHGQLHLKAQKVSWSLVAIKVDVCHDPTWSPYTGSYSGPPGQYSGAV